MNLESYAITLNRHLVIGQNSITRKEGLCCSALRAFGIEV